MAIISPDSNTTRAVVQIVEPYCGNFLRPIAGMPKIVSALEFSLRERSPRQSLSDWLYGELRSSILEGRLAPGTRLPASRDLAHQYGLSRGTVASVFERLQSEGYLSSQVGSGTWVDDRVKTGGRAGERPAITPAYIQRVAASYSPPKAFVGLGQPKPVRPFQMRNPALSEFPAGIWAKLMARRARGFD